MKTAPSAILLALGLSGHVASLAAQQCSVPATSNEGKLLALYTVPIAFAPATAPAVLKAGSIQLAGELAVVPVADTSLEKTGLCFTAKSEHTDLSRVFPRPRLIVGLPGGLAVEVSYLPPVTVANATPSLASAALSWTRAVGSSLVFSLRAHATSGRVEGPITCPSGDLQTADPGAPCFGSTPSKDAFHPTMEGGEASVGWASADSRFSAFAGGGATALQPSLRVGFTSGDGFTDTSTVKTSTSRIAFFGGATLRPLPALALSAQVYAVPADAVTARVSAAWRLRE